MLIDFLGVGSCLPEYAEADTASLLIDRHILVDAGWSTVRNLLRIGVDPGTITHVLFTHMHQDHYLGLVQLLFYCVNKYQHADHLTLCGPEGMEKIVKRAMLYAGFDRIFAGEDRKAAAIAEPQMCELPAEGQMTVGDLRISYIPNHHAVPGRCYRFTDPHGKSITYTGDTAPLEQLSFFAAGSDVLVHEAAFAAKADKGTNLYCHSSAFDAAEAARKANVKSLYLVHLSRLAWPDAINAAETIFPNVFCPQEGQQIIL